MPDMLPELKLYRSHQKADNAQYEARVGLGSTIWRQDVSRDNTIRWLLAQVCLRGFQKQ